MNRWSSAWLAAALIVVVGACGGSEPEARQRNTALCFASEEERAAAIAEAEAQVEALLVAEGQPGDEAPGDETPAPQEPADEAPADEAPAELEAPVEGEAPAEGDDVVGTNNEDASGGRGRFVTVARGAIDDNALLAAIFAENEAEESDELRQARMNLEEVGARPLCDDIEGDAPADDEGAATTVRESRECVVSAQFNVPQEDWATINVCEQATQVSVQAGDYGYGMPRGGRVSFKLHGAAEFNVQVKVNDAVVFDAPFAGEGSRSATYEVEVIVEDPAVDEEQQLVDGEENLEEPLPEEEPWNFGEPRCEGSATTTFEVLNQENGRVDVAVTTVSPEDCDDFVVAAVLEGSYSTMLGVEQAINQLGPDAVVSCANGDINVVTVLCNGLRVGREYTIVGFSESDLIRGQAYFEQWRPAGNDEQCESDEINLQQVDDTTFTITGCDSAERFRIRGLANRTIRSDSPTFTIEGMTLRPGLIDIQIKAYFRGPPSYVELTTCFELCEPSSTVEFVPANPRVGDAVWLNATDVCVPDQWYWKAYRADGVLHSAHPTHQPFIPSQGEAYRLVLTGTCADGTELMGETTVSVAAVPAPRHDDFNDPLVLPTESGTTSLNSTGSTLQAGEPKHSGCQWEGDNSVWFSYTATADGILQHQYLPGTFGVPTLTMYRGDSLETLERKNSWFTGDWVLNTAVFAGETYRFVIVGCYRSGFGEINLQWNFLPAEGDIIEDGNVEDPAGEEPAGDDAAGDDADEAEPIAGRQLVENVNPPAAGEPVQTREVTPEVITVSDTGVALDLPITIGEVTFSAETIDQLLEALNAPGSDAWIFYDGGQLVPLSGSERVDVRLAAGRTEIVLRDANGTERRIPVEISNAPKVGSAAAVTVVSSSVADEDGTNVTLFVIAGLLVLVVFGAAGFQIIRRRA